MTMTINPDCSKRQKRRRMFLGREDMKDYTGNYVEKMKGQGASGDKEM